jgi:hypothetical protein
MLEQHSTAQFRLVSNISTATQTGCHRLILLCEKEIPNKWVKNKTYYFNPIMTRVVYDT